MERNGEPTPEERYTVGQGASADDERALKEILVSRPDIERIYTENSPAPECPKVRDIEDVMIIALRASAGSQDYDTASNRYVLFTIAENAAKGR